MTARWEVEDCDHCVGGFEVHKRGYGSISHGSDEDGAKQIADALNERMAAERQLGEAQDLLAALSNAAEMYGRGIDMPNNNRQFWDALGNARTYLDGPAIRRGK